MYGWRGRPGLSAPTGNRLRECGFDRMAPKGVRDIASGCRGLLARIFAETDQSVPHPLSSLDAAE